MTEALDYSSAIVVFTYSLFLSIVVAGNIYLEAARVMILAPLAGFTATHILYLNVVDMDYGELKVLRDRLHPRDTLFLIEVKSFFNPLPDKSEKIKKDFSFFRLVVVQGAWCSRP